MNDPVPRSLPEGPSGAGHESTDVRPSFVALAGLGLLLTIGLVLCLLGWTFSRFRAAAAQREPSPGTLAEHQLPPEPRLQADPAADLARWRREQELRRSSYGRIEGRPEFVRIPVDRAMELLAERGFPEPAGEPAAPGPKDARP